MSVAVGDRAAVGSHFDDAPDRAVDAHQVAGVLAHRAHDLGRPLRFARRRRRERQHAEHAHGHCPPGGAERSYSPLDPMISRRYRMATHTVAYGAGGRGQPVHASAGRHISNLNCRSASASRSAGSIVSDVVYSPTW